MKNLWLSSILFVTIACSPTIHKDLQKIEEESSTLSPIFTTGRSYLYKAKIDILTHYLSGLLFIKPISEDTFRLVFTNELGVKFFDISYFPKGSKVHYVMEKLNKKVVLKTLEKDMKLFLMSDIDASQGVVLIDDDRQKKIYKYKVKKDYYFYFLDQKGMIIKIEDTSRRKVKVEVDVNDYKNGIPYFINIKHNSFKFNIELNYLER